MKQKIGCVLMAAGNSSRYKENKLYAEINSESLIDKALNLIYGLDVCKTVVVTQYDDVMEKAHSFGYKTIKNSHPEWGLSYTIKLGINELTDCDAIIFIVSDQPLLNKKSVAGLIEFFRANDNLICALGHHGRRGNPCVFPKVFYDELLSLKGDAGGSIVIKNNEDKFKLYDIENEKELFDIDTKDDLNKIIL